jgi:hypothetical protein
MSRFFAVLLAATLAAGAALAQGAGQGQAPAPGIALPPTVGGTTLTRSHGSTYQYAAANGMEITVDVYDNGRRVPNGSSHPTIINQFNEELDNIRQQAQAAGMSGFERPSVPSACTYGSYTLRCITFSAASGGGAGRVFGKFLLIGYREHFVKLIVRWTQASGQTSADADKLLTSFVPALLVR